MEFKWLQCGGHECICDDRGKIIGYVVPGFKHQPIGPVPAHADGKSLGIYINVDAAKIAVEDFLSTKRENLYAIR